MSEILYFSQIILFLMKNITVNGDTIFYDSIIAHILHHFNGLMGL